MKKLKLSESQIIKLLKEADQGMQINEICRKYGIGNSTYYKLKSKYAGMSVSELARLKELELENNRLKNMYADISLEHKILTEAMEKKFPGLIDEN